MMMYCLARCSKCPTRINRKLHNVKPIKKSGLPRELISSSIATSCFEIRCCLSIPLQDATYYLRGIHVFCFRIFTIFFCGDVTTMHCCKMRFLISQEQDGCRVYLGTEGCLLSWLMMRDRLVPPVSKQDTIVSSLLPPREQKTISST